MKYVRTDDFYERQLAQYAINLEDFPARKRITTHSNNTALVRFTAKVFAVSFN